MQDIYHAIYRTLKEFKNSELMLKFSLYSFSTSHEQNHVQNLPLGVAFSSHPVTCKKVGV